MPKGSSFRIPFDSHRVKVSQTLLKAEPQPLYPNFLLIWGKLTLKTSLLVRSEILGLFFNTLTTYSMYSRQNWENFPQQVQMQLFSKPLTFF